jgi:MscS family membrane protein
MLSKMSIVNMAERERMLIRTVINLPGDARDRIRYVLTTVEKMLVAHEKIHCETARARLTGYTGSSAEIEVFAYAMTRDTEEFLVVQEDVLLRVMDILEESKSARAADGAPRPTIPAQEPAAPRSQ